MSTKSAHKCADTNSVRELTHRLQRVLAVGVQHELVVTNKEIDAPSRPKVPQSQQRARLNGIAKREERERELQNELQKMLPAQENRVVLQNQSYVRPVTKEEVLDAADTNWNIDRRWPWRSREELIDLSDSVSGKNHECKDLKYLDLLAAQAAGEETRSYHPDPEHLGARNSKVSRRAIAYLDMYTDARGAVTMSVDLMYKGPMEALPKCGDIDMSLNYSIHAWPMSRIALMQDMNDESTGMRHVPVSPISLAAAVAGKTYSITVALNSPAASDTHVYAGRMNYNAQPEDESFVNVSRDGLRGMYNPKWKEERRKCDTRLPAGTMKTKMQAVVHFDQKDPITGDVVRIKFKGNLRGIQSQVGMTRTYLLEDPCDTADSSGFYKSAV